MRYTTLWEVPDPRWVKLAPILPPDKLPATVGRPALPNRQVLNGSLYVLRTGCQWKSLKKDWFGASRSIHDRYQAWRQAGLFARIFPVMLEYYDHVKRIQWRWQAIDSKLVPAPLGGEKTGKNPTDRGKLGSTRHILVDARGAPLAIVVSGANTHDKTCATEVLEAVRGLRPKRKDRVHPLCADKGYEYDDIRQAVREREYHLHLPRKGIEVQQVPAEKRHPARRWVVERTLAWQNDFRRLRVRWAKKAENWLAFIHLASAFLLWNMSARI